MEGIEASTFGSPWDGVAAAPVPFTSWGDATTTAMDCDGTQLAASEPVEEPWERYMDERLSQEYSYIMRETERAALATAALPAPAPVVLACMHNQMMVDRMGGSFGKRQQCAADLELSAKRHRG
ncbi:hypothetical protein Ctob_009554 [Chrysochromulina tobinii]|uniref:Uncharacterized protein n=1 Tax=Chrysochromulina tobinii TaxID=1460289 RepID=A0A0M0KC37_9EUKA|nr:hypothetical protein Ctob_009554 [Chrysochromulina tobinii]|eukprot:KOO36147.1 hypothetical protein Ctob_009554 [Chrysochromulina sp. CCMP291]